MNRLASIHRSPRIALLLFTIATTSAIMWSPPGVPPAMGADPDSVMTRPRRAPLPESLQPEPAPHFDGTGIIIAVIGSGIDYTHAAFGGAGDPEAFTSNDPATIEPDSFPSGVVVGGYDFAGDLYSSACPEPVPADVECSSIPTPDDDPLDRANGLGSSIASVALEAAPGARLVALKIFGEPDGVPAQSTLHARALEWVLVHNRGKTVPGIAPEGRIDVVLDSGGGGQWSARWAELNPIVDALAEDGVTVVAPAGDDGPTPFIVGGVGATDAAISVAAVIAQGEQTWGIRAEWAGEDGAPMVREHEALDARAPLGTVAGSETIVAPLAWYGLACSEDDGSPSEPAQDVRERIALVERGICPFVDKIQNAEANGAIAVLFFTDTRTMTNPQGGGGSAPSIPSAMIDRGPGQELQTLLEAGTAISVTLDAEYVFRKSWLDGTLLGSTSRGPSHVISGHPEWRLAAAGVDVSTAQAGSGVERVERTGSAIAAGAVAGAAARVAQRLAAEPLARAGDVAALLINTADPTVYKGRNDTGELAPVALQGAGLLDVEGALASTLIVRTDLFGTTIPSEPVFPVISFPESGTVLDVLNLGSRPFRANARFAPAFRETSPRGITFNPGVERVVIEPRSTSMVIMSSSSDLEAYPDWVLGDGNPIDDEAAFRQLEFDGWHEVFEVDSAGAPLVGGTVLRLPLTGIQRRPSRVARAEPRGAASMVLALTNPGPSSGEVVPSVGVGRDARDVYDRSPSTAALDILSVGVRHGPDPDAPPGETNPETLIEWRIQTLGPRVLPAETAFDVLLDLDRDGTFDRIVTSVRGPEARRGLSAIEWYSVVTFLKPGTLEPDFSRMTPDPIAIEWDILETTTSLRARATELVLDLESGDEEFDFAVRTRDPLKTSPVLIDGEVFDQAPDDLESGARFTFDQRVHGCLAFELEDGTPIHGLGSEGSLVLDSGASAAIQMTWSCDHPPMTRTGKSIEALFTLADNVRNSYLIDPDTQVIAVPVSLSAYGGGYSIFLPLVRLDRP